MRYEDRRQNRRERWQGWRRTEAEPRCTEKGVIDAIEAIDAIEGIDRDAEGKTEGAIMGDNKTRILNEI